LHRPRQHSADDPVACFVTALHTDALIAATAVVHDLAVVTRNVDDFVRAGIAVVNPWKT
jgi:hypothetical protein